MTENIAVVTEEEEDEGCLKRIEEWEEDQQEKSILNSSRKTTSKRRREDDLSNCKKLKFNMIEEGCWGEDKVGLVSVPGVPQPYQPLPQRVVVRRGRRGCIITRGQVAWPKPDVFTP